MTSDNPKGAARTVRTLLVYLGLGLITFAVVAAWNFAGLAIWGH